MKRDFKNSAFMIQWEEENEVPMKNFKLINRSFFTSNKKILEELRNFEEDNIEKEKTQTPKRLLKFLTVKETKK